MSTIYPGMIHLNGNLLAAIDFETTGRRPGFHEIVQIAILPLDSDIRPLKTVRPFYMNVQPQYPNRQEKEARLVHQLNIDDLLIHAPTADRVADLLVEWFQRLDLPQGKVLVPLVQNWAFESAFLKAWLGPDMVDSMFHSHARDPMLYAVAMNDKATFMGEELPFNRVGLESLCNRLGIINTNPHDALSDCLATAEVYRAMLTLNLV